MKNSEKTNILIVDDLPEKILVLESVLESLGQNIIAARSGREALRQVLQRDFAVILLDVNMPDIDGFETATLIRERRQSADTPIIFITAFNDEVHTARGYSLGAVDYIYTPVVPEILRTKVSVFVDLYRKTEMVRRQAQEHVTLAWEQSARIAAEEATRRSTFLAEASKILASSLEYEHTLHSLLRLMVPQVAEFSVLAMTDQLHRPKHTVATWRGADAKQMDPALLEPESLHPRLVHLMRETLETRQARCIAKLDFSEAPIAIQGPDSIVPPLLASVLTVPLPGQGRVLGTMLLGSSGRTYNSMDLALAEDVAARAAAALDNALLYRELRDADRQKNEFLAMLAHELRNPLAPIRSAVHILRSLPVKTAQVGLAYDIIDRQVHHLVRLVDDLLDVSRITRGKISLDMAPVHLADVIRQAVETSQPLFHERRQQLTVAAGEESVHAYGDATRLAQVFSNLLNNASKYTPEFGKISIHLSREDNMAVVRVRDSGVGIPNEMLTKIFDLFTQVDCSLERSQGGLGIGLTLVRRLVEMHNGSVHASSAGPDCGSEFVVRLPAVAEWKPKNGAPILGQPTRSTPRRILIVDDNVDGADSIGMLFRSLGHQIRIAYNGASALEIARPFAPEVVLLDIGLPGLDGFEVARQLRHLAETSRSLLVALTGYGQDADRVRSREVGFDAHFVKPVDISALVSLIGKFAFVEEGQQHAHA